MKSKNNQVEFSVGICAFNEAKNIAKSIKSIFSQNHPQRYKLKEIIVVASGCTDNTVDIVKNLQGKYNNIKLFIQKNREGKAVAVNMFLKNARSKICVLQSADTIPEKNCYKYMLSAFDKPDIGIVGCKVVPLDDPETLCGFANNMKWKLHHEINIKFPERPKLGELIAFRKIFSRIPPKTAVDEASIEPIIKLQDFRAYYEPRSIVYNSGPKSVREYLSRRRSIYAGHLETKLKYGYEVITFSNFGIIPVFLSSLKIKPKYLTFAAATAIFEIIARLFGYLDIKYKLREQSVWKIAKTSKEINLNSHA